MTRRATSHAERTIRIAFTVAELEHLHQCLTGAKQRMTGEGRVWPLHGLNAHLRTTIERAWNDLENQRLKAQR